MPHVQHAAAAIDKAGTCTVFAWKMVHGADAKVTENVCDKLVDDSSEVSDTTLLLQKGEE